MDLERIRQIAERVASSEGLELLAVEWAGPTRGGVLRLTIDRLDTPVNHRDCQAVSDQLGTLLDVEGLVDGRYTLEVASPGLDRKLYKPADYERFRGRRVKVRLKRPLPSETLAANQRRFEAQLEGLAEGQVSFRLNDQVIRVPLDEIEAVNLVVEF